MKKDQRTIIEKKMDQLVDTNEKITLNKKKLAWCLGVLIILSFLFGLFFSKLFGVFS